MIMRYTTRQPQSLHFIPMKHLKIFYCHPGACQTTQKLVHFYMLIALKHKKVVESL